MNRTTGRKRGGRRGWRPFEEAREFVRGLRLKGWEEWREYSKSGQRPDDIPGHPSKVYKDEWLGMGDWLGTGRRGLGGKWRPFEEAREFVRGLGLKNQREWNEYSKSGQRPDNIPADPSKAYADEWLSWGDWLGTGRRLKTDIWPSFEEAREFARGLGLRSWQEWNEYSKSGRRPASIPSAPNEVYKDEWRGIGDWLGAVNVWNRTALLAFLEDLRSQLPHLEGKELYLIIQQGGAMPTLRQAFGKTSAHKVLKDLKDNGGRGLEQALKDTPEEELEQDHPPLAPENSGEVLEAHAPPSVPEDSASDGDEHVQRGESGLPTLVTGPAMRAIDELAKLHHGLDDETAQYLVDNRVAALWDAYTNGGFEAIEEALEGEGGHYFGLIRSRFNEELEGAQNLPVPAGWAFRPPGKQDEAPSPPNLMQRRTAIAVLTRRRVGNWSGVGSGKTLSGILASRVAGCRHTLIICNKATVRGWCDEIRRAFPGTVVHTSPSATPAEPGFANGGYAYTVLNYEKFQQPSRNSLVRKLVSAGVDFVILDEVQLVKQRDKNASYRRQAVAALLSLLQEQNRNLHVLGMSATPVINTLLEARKLLEIVKGRSFADLHTLPTVNNALAVHRALMVNGLRYRPRYETEIDLAPLRVVRNDLLEELRLAEGVLGLEQTLLPAKLEAIREHVRPGTLIYTYYVDGMVGPARDFVEGLGYRVGLYTGADKTGLQPFLERRADILVGSQPVGTGLDGLQTVCDRIIILSPPWTSAEYEQIVGRVRRQGSAFSRMSVMVPQVVLEHKGEEWSWDAGRMRTIEFKRTLSDCAVDGHVPEVSRISEKELLEKSRVALEEWIRRVEEDGPLAWSGMRPELRVPLPPEARDKLIVTHGDFATLNNRWVSSNSETVHKRLKTDPAEWYLYHTLYREHRKDWPEVPAGHIATHLKGRPDLRVGDFGCGECLLKEALGDGHEVIGLDHVAHDATVLACDMAHAPLEDGSLGAAVFSLSLMGRNWRGYLEEAHRTLQPFGLLFVAEPARRWEEDKLEAAVEEAGFGLLLSYRRGDFLYVQAVKRGL